MAEAGEPDPRTSSGQDPYRELEIYLEKINAEIGELFDKWQPSSPTAAAPATDPETKKLPTAPFPPPRTSSRSKLVAGNCSEKAPEHQVVPDVVKSLKCNGGAEIRPRRRARLRNSRRYNTDTVLNDWNVDFLAEFNNVIAHELDSLAKQPPRREAAYINGYHGGDSSSIGTDPEDDEMVRFRVGKSHSLSAPVSGSASPVASPSPTFRRKGWLRRKVVDDAVLVRVSPLEDELTGSVSDSDIERKKKSSVETRMAASTSSPTVSEQQLLPDLVKGRCATLPSSYSIPRKQNQTEKEACLSSPPRRKAANLKRSPPVARPRKLPKGSPDLLVDDDVLSSGSNGGLPTALQSLLQKLRPSLRKGTPPSTPANTPTTPNGPLNRSPFFTKTNNDNGGRSPSPCQLDAGTQTSPAISRSSSFTWVSDCSSLPILDLPDMPNTPGSVSEDDRMSSSSSGRGRGGPNGRRAPSTDDCLSSVDSADSPSESPVMHQDDEWMGSSRERRILDDAEGHESGIGTASPPPHSRGHKGGGGTRSGSAGEVRVSGRRKEAWRPRRADDVVVKDTWVRRESVETQTVVSKSSHHDSEERNHSDNTPSLDAISTVAILGDPAVDSDNQTMDSSSGVEESGDTGSALSVTSLPQQLQRPKILCIPGGKVESNGISGTPAQSPSAVSLGPTAPLPVEMGSKSSSAPLLVKPVDRDLRCGLPSYKRILRQPRSQSDRDLAEIEAAEACKWLRAAGFPQYAQMYEDQQFPVDVDAVAKDHPFLEPESLQSLFRRLGALNRTANMKVDNLPSKQGEDSDEDDHCALSENWTFQPESRRWSRVCDVSAEHAERLQALSAAASQQSTEQYDTEGEGSAICMQPPSRPDPRVLQAMEGAGEQPVVISAVRFGSLPLASVGGLPTDPDLLTVRFRRSGSERLKDGAKALLRRMESLKTRRKRQNREGVVIGHPQVLDVAAMQQRMSDLNCVDVSLSSQTPTQTPGSPGSPRTLQRSRPSRLQRATNRLLRRDSSGGEPAVSLSDSECQPASWALGYLKDANSNNTKVLDMVQVDVDSSKDEEEASSRKKQATAKAQGRTGSLNLGKDSQRFREKLQPSIRRGISVESGNIVHPSPPSSLAPPSPNRGSGSPSGHSPDEPRVSTYDNVPHSPGYSPGYSPTSPGHAALAAQVNLHARPRMSHSASPTPDRTPHAMWATSSEMTGSHDSNSTLASQPDSERDEEGTPRHRAAVVRWHSFQRGPAGRPESFGVAVSPSPGRVCLTALSCGQLLVLRKLALLKLTACMESHCPTHRSGWNWELPKFIRKIKTPDYKDKTVFGVPLLLSLQRSGQALPPAIQKALRWLRTTSIEQVGLFRKPGVKSRIMNLKAAVESQGEAVSFDGQQAYDVADMVKQFFRELPEALLTNKLSETFISIFQHVDAPLRQEAVACVLLLLPDEHREALRALLEFLHAITLRADTNQMSASNLAVCLAPSLLRVHNHSPVSSSSSSPAGRSTSASPRRRNKSIGAPDPKEIGENRAAHECVLHLIKHHRDLFTISEETLSHCHFTYMEESVPVSLDELGGELNLEYNGYLNVCINALLREARDRGRGWVSVNGGPDLGVDVAYRKVGDGHPLRLWRVSTDVEAPPTVLLQRILRERHTWDTSLLQCRVAARLSEQTEVFQYVCSDMPPLPNRDYCVARLWRSDLQKGACVVVETSVEHSNAPVLDKGVRGIVLASRYLIEPCGSGKSRIIHFSRVDTKGRTPEWYNKCYGHICAQHLARIRASFRHNAEGPESKV